jgi:hypothetical protein
MEFKWPGEKLIEKMWDTLTDKGVGSLLKPWQTVREGRAQTEVRRHELLALAQAEADAAEVKAGKKRFLQDGTLVPLIDASNSHMLLIPASDSRIEPTLDMGQLILTVSAHNAANIIQSEVNVARTIVIAEQMLGQETQEPSSQNIEDDWLSTWRDHVAKVSSEQLQNLWASVLAGEVKTPGTYSIRTLDFLRTLSKAEAEQISRIAEYNIQGGIVREVEPFSKFEIFTFGDLLQLQELGIITGVDAVGLSNRYPSLDNDKFLQVLVCHKKLLIIEREGEHMLELPIFKITKLGAELLNLGSFSANIDYLTAVGKKIISMGYSVKLADVIRFNDNGIEFENQVSLTA